MSLKAGNGRHLGGHGLLDTVINSDLLHYPQSLNPPKCIFRKLGTIYRAIQWTGLCTDADNRLLETVPCEVVATGFPFGDSYLESVRSFVHVFCIIEIVLRY